jgi:hypothetical protein
MRQREHLFVTDAEREKEEEQEQLEAEGLDDAEIQRVIALLVPASAGPPRRQ